MMSEKPTTIIRRARGSDIPFFIMSRPLAQDRELSFEARGVMAYLLSKPDDWKVQPSDLEQLCGSRRVYRILKELRDAGYMELKQERSGQRIVGWVYEVHEVSVLRRFEEVQKLHVQKLHVQKGDITENRVLHSTDSTEGQRKDSLPDGKGEKSSSGKKERNPIFDAVAQHIFGIMPEEISGADGGRIGAIAAWLEAKSDGVTRGKKKLTVGFISQPAEPRHVEGFAAAYKAKSPGLSLPKDFEKFVESWRAWASSKKEPANSSYEPVYRMSAEDAREAEAEAMQMLAEAKRRALQTKGLQP